MKAMIRIINKIFRSLNIKGFAKLENIVSVPMFGKAFKKTYKSEPTISVPRYI